MQVLHERFQNNPNVVVVSIHYDNEGNPQAYMKENGYTFPLINDGGSIARRYGVKKIPAYFVIGPDGRVLATAAGRLTDNLRDTLAGTAEVAAAEAAGGG